MAYETAVLKQLEAYTAKHISRMGGFSPHIRLTDYPKAVCRIEIWIDKSKLIVYRAQEAICIKNAA